MRQFLIPALLLLHPDCFQALPLDGHDYGEVLRLSLQFYEAQRSGHLPHTSRIPWRKDSALTDQGQDGEDLTGGYYDASDFVKFSFTMAFTTTLLSWSVLSHKAAYDETGQYSYALDAIKWASDYFIKCHVNPNEFYGQVGDFDLDHLFWGRPEELNMSRPAYKIDIDHPGSELAGEAAAALAATSLVFRHVDEKYSNTTLRHAKELYDFAVDYKGLYNDAIPGAKKYYESTDYGDDLAWAAIWLYKSTKNINYLQDAEQFYLDYHLTERPDKFFFNKKNAGVQVLLAELTKRTGYIDAVASFCDFSVNKQKRTPKGLIYIDKFGTLSHAANVAYICLQASNLGISSQKYDNFAKQQLNYILGNSGRSYVVGYGKDYPKHPNHAASSCPDAPAICDWSSYSNPGPNPQILYGALVSGPDENDYYEDTREEFLYNEVSLDYNAGFQGIVAGLLHKKLLSC